MSLKTDVKQWRKAQKKSQADVAKAIGVTRGAFALWEQGRSSLGKPRIAALELLMHKKVTSPERALGGADVLVKAWKQEVERITALPVIKFAANSAVLDAATVITTAYMKKTPVAPKEFVGFYARVVDALN